MAVVFLAVVVFGFGFMLGILCMDGIGLLMIQRCFIGEGSIRLKRYGIGDDEFKISIFKLKHQKFIENYMFGGDVRPFRQVRDLQCIVEEIVWSIVRYDLKWFKTDEFQEAIQSKVNAFAENLAQYNDFIKKPGARNMDNLSEACRELKEANQPILDYIKKLRDEVNDYIKSGNYKLIDFES